MLAGIASGLGAARLTTRNDRRERFRDRLIASADDFGAALAEALLQLRDAIGEVVSLRDPAQMKEATEGTWAARDAVLRRSQQIDLLFGPKSPTALSCARLLEHLATAVQELQPPSFDPGAAEKDAPQGER